MRLGLCCGAAGGADLCPFVGGAASLFNDLGNDVMLKGRPPSGGGPSFVSIALLLETGGARRSAPPGNSLFIWISLKPHLRRTTERSLSNPAGLRPSHCC